MHKNEGLFIMLINILTAVASVVFFGTSAMASEERYIILMGDEELPESLDTDIETAGGKLVRTLPQVGVAIATSSNPDFELSASAIKGVAEVGASLLYSLPDLTSRDAAEPAANGAVYSDLGWLWGIDRIHAPDAWDNGHTGEGVVIGIIDSGVAWNHPDLSSNVISAKCFTTAGTDGGDFTIGDCNPYPDVSWHGTHVAGTAAASFGYVSVGVAPKAKIASYNVFEYFPGFGVLARTDSRWAAMLHAADNGVDVINMSLGGYIALGSKGSNYAAAFIAAEKRVARYVAKKGTVLVASSGNDDVDLNGNIFHLPGDIPEIINVGATGIQQVPRYPHPDSYDIRAFYSNYGAAITISAPGGDCGEIDGCSRFPGMGYPWYHYLTLSSRVDANPTCAATFSCSIGWLWAAGTSMAAPHVAGVAALVKAANPHLNPKQVKAILMSTAEPIGSHQDFGAGMVRADWAIENA